MTPLEKDIRALAPEAYMERATILGLNPLTDMSRSNQCQNLTFDMMEALQHRGHEVQREYHEDTDGIWHFLLVHTDGGARPSNDDIVTDMNPWQWADKKIRHTGLLHATRGEIIEQLGQAGAPDYYIALRGIQTIRLLHVPVR